MLADGLAKLNAYYETRYEGVELDFRSALNKTVLDRDLFGGHFTENTGYVCPRLTDLFVHEYLK